MTVKEMKKVLYIFVISVCMLLADAGTVFAAEFSDVSSEHINYYAITQLTGLGVISGYDDGSFKPDREITRTEFCALMARTLGYKKDEYQVKKVPFSDVSDGYWGKPFISFCYESGLIDGMGDGTFAPAAKVTLEQAIKMSVCAIGKQADAAKFSDEKWYSGYAQAANQAGLLVNVDQSFGQNATRGSVAQVVSNMLKTGEVKPWIPDEPSNSDKPDDKTEQPTTNTEPSQNNISPEIAEAYKKKDFSDVKKILIDAGHNYSGKDIGAENKQSNAKEEIITWQIANKLKIELEKLGYSVVMTRSNVTDSIANTSVTESLQARVDMAHENLADLFISIHCNAGGGSGTETYCFSTEGYSGRLATLIQKNIASNTNLYDRGVKTANFYVIKNTLMPAVLVETGFIDNEKDIKVLMSEQGQTQLAQAIASAVKKFDEMPAIVDIED